jgi:transposase-like protein
LQENQKALFFGAKNFNRYGGPSGELSVAEICRKRGIAESMFYKWNKEFPEAGKKRLAGDTTTEATAAFG